MKKIILSLVLITNFIFANSIKENEKSQAEQMLNIWLKEVFKMKAHDDYKTRNKIVKNLLPYSRKNNIKYVNKKIAQFWAIKNRVKKRDKNDMYNPQTDFSYSFKTKYKQYNNFRKKILLVYTIFDYQNLEDNFNVIYLTKVNGKWKI